MRELDVLLERWLTERWPAATPAERALFERLLGCEDDQLWDWCMGRSRPDDVDLASIVEQVLAPVADRDSRETGG